MNDHDIFEKDDTMNSINGVGVGSTQAINSPENQTKSTPVKPPNTMKILYGDLDKADALNALSLQNAQREKSAYGHVSSKNSEVIGRSQ